MERGLLLDVAVGHAVQRRLLQASQTSVVCQYVQLGLVLDVVVRYAVQRRPLLDVDAVRREVSADAFWIGISEGCGEGGEGIGRVERPETEMVGRLRTNY